MGQFTSRCPKCQEPYYWFLKATDHECKSCGTFMSAEETEDIWSKECAQYQEMHTLYKYHKYSFSIQELESTPWNKLPNVYFNCGAENSRDQELRLAKTRHLRSQGFYVPNITFISKAAWDDLLALENEKRRI